MLPMSCVILMFFLVLILLGALVHMLITSLMRASQSLARLTHRQKQSLEIEVAMIEPETVEVVRSN